ncbi:MAG TPA: hypothetical protein GXX51_06295 [Firmicutes bacterium]|nr:hypothetical protein [Bacillota bacterium]
MAQEVMQTLDRQIKEYAADRGFYSTENESELESLGIRHIAIPKPGRCSLSRKKGT